MGGERIPKRVSKNYEFTAGWEHILFKGHRILRLALASRKIKPLTPGWFGSRKMSPVRRRRAAAAGRDHRGHSIDLRLTSVPPWRPLPSGRAGPWPEDSLVFSASAAETSTPTSSGWEQHLERRDVKL